MSVCNNFARKTLRLFLSKLIYAHLLQYTGTRVSAAPPNQRYKRLGFSLASLTQDLSIHRKFVQVSLR